MQPALAWPAAITSAWLSGSPVMPAGEVGDQRDGHHLGAQVAGGDRLHHGGHPDQVAPKPRSIAISAGVS